MLEDNDAKIESGPQRRMEESGRGIHPTELLQP